MASTLGGPDPVAKRQFGDFNLDLSDAVNNLARREQDLVSLLGMGWSMEAIADEWNVRRKTVYRQVKQLRQKLKSLEIYL